MLPMQYLAAMVYYFIYAQAKTDRNVTNKGVAATQATFINLWAVKCTTETATEKVTRRTNGESHQKDHQDNYKCGRQFEN